jgi:CRP-like cAMP-binding protein
MSIVTEQEIDSRAVAHCQRGFSMAALTPSDLDFVSHVAVFGGLKRDMLERVIAPASVVRFAKRQPVFRQNDFATAFFIVVRGWVKLYRITPAGEEVVIDVLAKGESLAVAAAFTGGRHAATAEAVSNSCIVRIPVKHVVRCMREMPEVALAVMASTFHHFHRVMQQIEQLKTQSGVQRVAEFVASLCPVDVGPCVVALPYDKGLIAGRLGIKPESLSRAFARLKSVGVEVRASCVAVSDVSRLRRLAADERCMSPVRRQSQNTNFRKYGTPSDGREPPMPAQLSRKMGMPLVKSATRTAI